MRRLEVIDGLRGYAVIAVVLFHMFSSLVAPRASHVWYVGEVPVFPYMFLSCGYLIVGFFFLLSGFVLALPYARGERTISSSHDVFHFYLRRAQRLLPLYVLMIAVVFLLRDPDPVTGSSLLDIFLLGTGLNAFHPQLAYPPYYVVFWTMQVEIWLSVLFPLMYAAGVRWGSGLLLAPSMLISTLTDAAALEFSYWMKALNHSFLSAAGIFAAGICIAGWYTKGRIPRSYWIFAAGVVLILIGFWLPEAVHAGFMPRTSRILIQLFLTPGFGLLLAAALMADSRMSRMVLANRPVQMAGMMCFSIYLIHPHIFRYIRPSSGLFHFMEYWVVLLLLSLLTYRFVEFPRRAFVRLLPAKTSRK